VAHEAEVASLKEQLAAAEKCAEDVTADMQDKLRTVQVRPADIASSPVLPVGTEQLPA
jgi:hypothetical protein